MDKLKKIFHHGSQSPEPRSQGSYQSTPAQTQSSYSSSGANTAPQSGYSSSAANTAPQSGYSSSSANTAPQSGYSSSSQQAPSGEMPSGVLLTTNYGDITIALYSDKTPKTCRNFATLADTHKYDNVVFHRIIPGFMIQGGDPTGTGRGGSSIYGGKFEDEFDRSLIHSGKGVLSMANSGPGTNGSQFFITLGPTPHLNGKHTVFGQVVAGMDVVDMIGNARTDASDRPLQEIKIVRAQSFVA